MEETGQPGDAARTHPKTRRTDLEIVDGSYDKENGAPGLAGKYRGWGPIKSLMGRAEAETPWGNAWDAGDISEGELSISVKRWGPELEIGDVLRRRDDPGVRAGLTRNGKQIDGNANAEGSPSTRPGQCSNPNIEMVEGAMDTT